MKLEVKVEGQSWDQSWDANWTLKLDSGVQFVSQLGKSEQLAFSNLIKIGTKVDCQVGPKLGYCEMPY